MTNEEYADILADTTLTILQDAAFVFAEQTYDPLVWEDDVIETELEFSGDLQGRLMLAVPRPIGVEIAANMLGVEPDDPDVENQLGPAACEMLNMVAGSLVAAWSGEESVCQIGIPDSKTVSPSQRSDWSAAATCAAALVSEDGAPIEIAAVIG